METDRLGPPYQRRTLDLGRDREGPVFATLVRRRAAAPTDRAVLWVHGWSDYFFQTHVADHFTARGFDFYALDLRKYGRSLRSYQTPGFCHQLTEYYPELDAAARIIRDEEGHSTLLVAAHSTGGLIASLWAHDRRGRGLVDGLFLNSPFFDVNLPSTIRGPALGFATRIARQHPYRVLQRPTFPLYGHSLHVAFRGEWSYDLTWKPLGGFPIRYGWLAAVRDGQRRLHAGLEVEAPVLVACSTRSLWAARWREDAHRADTVLDVADIVRWAPSVGRHVTVLRVEGGMHDLTLSPEPARQTLFSELDRWLDAYLGPAAGALPPQVAAPVARSGEPVATAPPTVDAVPPHQRRPGPANPARPSETVASPPGAEGSPAGASPASPPGSRTAPTTPETPVTAESPTTPEAPRPPARPPRPDLAARTAPSDPAAAPAAPD